MIKKIIYSFLVIIISNNVRAQVAEPTILSGAVSYDIPSKILNTQIRISVSLPQGYDKNGSKKYPVLYVLDGFYSFPIIHELNKVMSGEIEPVIIVGLGDNRMSIPEWLVSRYPLLTHDKDTYEDSYHSNNMKTKLVSGSGQLYYDAIKTEVIPFIEKNYATNDDRGLVGHSLGGLFTSHVLFKDNGYFKRFGINSAALFVNDEEPFKLEQKYFDSKKQLVGKVFLSAAGLEGDTLFVIRTNNFANALRSRQYRDLKVDSYIFPDESHGSVIGAMLSRSLYSLYGLNVDRSIGKGHKAAD